MVMAFLSLSVRAVAVFGSQMVFLACLLGSVCAGDGVCVLRLDRFVTSADSLFSSYLRCIGDEKGN